MLVSSVKAFEAAAALGVELEGLTERSLNSAYRAKAKDCHPDHHGSAQLTAWARISWAKECLSHWLKHHPSDAVEEAPVDVSPKGDCRACGGTGRVKIGTGFSKSTMMCVMCRGEGSVSIQEIDLD